MSRHTRLIASLTAAGALGIAVLGCGGGSAPAASNAAPPETAAPEASADAAPTPAPVESAAGAGEPTTASGGIDLGGAAASLETLDNYSFRIEMTAEGGADFMIVASGGSMVMEGDVVLRPDPAVDMTMTTSDGVTETAIGYRIIGDTAYMTLGGDSWISTPAEDAQQAVDAFKPEQLLGSYAGLEGMTKVGDEDRNGIPTEHWSTTYDPGVGSMFGLPDGSWTSDVWIARDGGFVVAALMVVTGTNDAGVAGTFTMALDVTGVNDPGLVVEKPANVMDLGG